MCKRAITSKIWKLFVFREYRAQKQFRGKPYAAGSALTVLFGQSVESVKVLDFRMGTESWRLAEGSSLAQENGAFVLLDRLRHSMRPETHFNPETQGRMGSTPFLRADTKRAQKRWSLLSDSK